MTKTTMVFAGFTAVLALAGCKGKGGSSGGGSGPEIKTKQNTLENDFETFTGLLPDWTRGDNAYGHGKNELYVGDLAAPDASFKVDHWSDQGITKPEDPKEALSRESENLLGQYERLDDGTKLMKDEVKLLVDNKPLGSTTNAWVSAISFDTGTGTDKGINVHVHVAAPDPQNKRLGFECMIVVHKRGTSKVDYMPTWQKLADLCPGLKMTPKGK